MERIAALELTTRPELDRSQSQVGHLRRHRQARMHQNTTLGQLFAAPIDLTDPALPNESNTLWLIALIGNLLQKLLVFRSSFLAPAILIYTKSTACKSVR